MRTWGLLTWCGLAWGGEGATDGVKPEPRSGPEVRFRASGHVKSFAVGTFPYDSPILPEAPVGQGFVDGRLNLSLDVGTWFHAEVAHAVTIGLGAQGGLETGVLSAGVGLLAPEALPLTWFAGDTPGSGFRVQGRTDRWILQARLTSVDATLGRQPISFGQGRFFTPLDLVSPFTPAVIDTEYKPGVDAFRVDVYPSFSSKITMVAAYTGQEGWKNRWTPQDVTVAVYGQGTVGLTDLGALYTYVLGDHVAGVSMATSVGPVGVYGDAALTVPRQDLDEAVFGRITVGMDGRPSPTTTVFGEAYVQTLGSTDPQRLVGTLSGERARRGEIWLSGLAYLGLGVQQEITPLVTVGLTTLTNLTDPSNLVLPSLTWSISNNSDLMAGAYLPIGRRPEARQPTADDLLPVQLGSEFGTYPYSVFLQVRAYF